MQIIERRESHATWVAVAVNKIEQNIFNNYNRHQFNRYCLFPLQFFLNGAQRNVFSPE